MCQRASWPHYFTRTAILKVLVDVQKWFDCPNVLDIPTHPFSLPLSTKRYVCGGCEPFTMSTDRWWTGFVPTSKVADHALGLAAYNIPLPGGVPEESALDLILFLLYVAGVVVQQPQIRMSGCISDRLDVVEPSSAERRKLRFCCAPPNGI